MVKVYLATSGEYSDYRVEHVFARREDADAYECADEVEEREVHEGPVETRTWWTLSWNAQNPDRADAPEKWMINPSEYPRLRDWDKRSDYVRHHWQERHGDPFVLHVEGWDLQRVRKVYSEQRAQYIAARVVIE